MKNITKNNSTFKLCEQSECLYEYVFNSSYLYITQYFITNNMTNMIYFV